MVFATAMIATWVLIGLTSVARCAVETADEVDTQVRLGPYL